MWDAQGSSSTTSHSAPECTPNGRWLNGLDSTEDVLCSTHPQTRQTLLGENSSRARERSQSQSSLHSTQGDYSTSTRLNGVNAASCEGLGHRSIRPSTGPLYTEQREKWSSCSSICTMKSRLISMLTVHVDLKEKLSRPSTFPTFPARWTGPHDSFNFSAFQEPIMHPRRGVIDCHHVIRPACRLRSDAGSWRCMRKHVKCTCTR